MTLIFLFVYDIRYKNVSVLRGMANYAWVSMIFCSPENDKEICILMYKKPKLLMMREKRVELFHLDSQFISNNSYSLES